MYDAIFQSDKTGLAVDWDDLNLCPDKAYGQITWKEFLNAK